MTGAIFTPLIPILLVAGVFADWQHGVEWAGNLAAFGSWATVVLLFFGLLIDYPAWLKSDTSKGRSSATGRITRAGLAGLILIQVAAGWSITPGILAALWLMVWAKFAEFKARKKREATE